MVCDKRKRSGSKWYLIACVFTFSLYIASQRIISIDSAGDTTAASTGTISDYNVPKTYLKYRAGTSDSHLSTLSTKTNDYGQYREVVSATDGQNLDVLGAMLESVGYQLENNTVWNSGELERLAEETIDHRQSFFDIQPSLLRSVNGSMKDPLPGLKTPCWIERYQGDYLPHRSAHVLADMRVRNYEGNFADLYKLKKKRASIGVRTHLRCLPAVYIGGVYKGGTTDLTETMALHDAILQPVIKEPLLHLWKPHADLLFKFEDYLQMYDLSTEELITLMEKNKNRRNPSKRAENKLMYDGTVTLLQMYAATWRDQAWNKLRDESRLHVAHHLKVVNPTAKYIFMLRDPLRWLESCYNYFFRFAQINSTVSEFHTETISAIDNFNACLRETRNVKRCAYENNRDVCSIINALYYVYVKQWFEIIPREQITILKSEDYFKNRQESLNRVFRFLGVPDLTDTDTVYLKNSKPYNRQRSRLKLNKATIDAASEFIKPWNVKLALLLQDESYVWG